MATVAEANALLSQYDDIILASLASLSSLVNQMAAISPTDPNAASTLQRLESQYQSIRSQAQSQADAVYAQYSAVYDSLTPAQKQQADTSPQAVKHKQVVADAAANKARHQSVYDAKNAEIKAAQTATPIPTPTETTAGAPPANTKPGLAGAASDDSGAGQPNPAGSTGTPSAPASTTSSTAGSTPGAKSATPPNTASGPADDKASTKSKDGWVHSEVVNQSVNHNSQPGRRLKNPLGDFSSYTYQLSLYMVTPDAYEAFVNSGRTKLDIINNIPAEGNVKGGAYLVAQSGGINNSSIPRAPNFEFDYGIDDLRVKSIVSGKKEGAPTQFYEVGFKIYEPYGFSFLTNLRRAGDTLYGANKGLGAWGEPNGNKLRQLFVLGIRFFGYDASGRIMNTTTNLLDASGVIDPTSTGGMLFERFLDIQITEMKFKIDGRMVVYNVKAIQANAGKGFNLSRGVLTSDTTVTAATVGDAVEQLLAYLNKEQQDSVKGDKPARGIANEYEIKWMPGTELIYNASIVSPADIKKTQWPGSGAKNSAESNPAQEQKNQTAEPEKTQIALSHSNPIISHIQQIVKQSDFMRTQLKTIYTTNEESDPKTKNYQKLAQSKPARSLSWFNITPEIVNLKWDNKTKDWAYKIRYIITEYKTPVNESPMVNPNNDLYPGPVKRYDYWYTGENTEILTYEQTMDNTYMQVVVGVGDSVLQEGTAAGNGTGSGGQTVAPVQPNLREPLPRYGGTGYAMDAQNSFLTALFDAKAYLQAKVTILGDPDWLPVTAGYGGVQDVYDMYYGKDKYSINTSGTQVFVEIDFKEAVDYTSQTGTMNINESIAFVKYPDGMKNKPKGVSYQVLSVEHSFSGGVFKQTLNLIGNTFGDKATQDALAKQVDEANRQQTVATEAAGPKEGPNPDQSNTPANSGTTQDKPTNPSTPPTDKPTDSSKTPAAPVNKNGVATEA